ncbi:MAG: DUF3857 domain-containing protein [Myxococcales bacterium]|nr:DUF3857 domain-containing protein [Myxococcales bacterium]
MPHLSLALAIFLLGSWVGPVTALAVGRPVGERTSLRAADPQVQEGERIWRRIRTSWARGPGASADLIRLDKLSPWLPPRWVETRLSEVVQSRRARPLVSSVAGYLLRNRLNRRLATDEARGIAQALGLIGAWVYRSGPAGAPTEVLDRAVFREAPEGADVLALQAFLHPATDTSATVATRLTGRPGPAVLRLGFDDEVTVWLNGDELYKSSERHTAFIDQLALPITLLPGDNRLVIEVRQRTGAWELMARVTDDAGRPRVDVTAHKDPFGPLNPTDAFAPRPKAPAPESLYTELLAVMEVDPPRPQELLDLVVYAQASGMPEVDQLTIRVAAENAYEAAPSASALNTWLDLVPEVEHAAILLSHDVPRPLRENDELAFADLQIRVAWNHFHARRFVTCRRLLAEVDRAFPQFGPALKLEANLLEEFDLPNEAVARLKPYATPDEPSALRTAHRQALKAAGRTAEWVATLNADHAAGEATSDEVYQLAAAHELKGREAEAEALMASLVHRRPALWSYLLDSLDRALSANRLAVADRLVARIVVNAPDDPEVLDAQARLAKAKGQTDLAVRLLKRAAASDPGNPERGRRLGLWDQMPSPVILGPPLRTLVSRRSPSSGSGHVLYHHARVEVAENGWAKRDVRRVVRILDATGAEQLGVWELPYLPGRQRLELLRAERRRAEEVPQNALRGDRDVSSPETGMYLEQRVEVLTFPRLEPGDVLDVAWRLTDLASDDAFPGYFGEVAYLQEHWPRAESIIEARGPKRLVFEVAQPEGSTLKVESAAGRVRLVDAPGVPLEPYGPGVSALRAYVNVSTLEGWGPAAEAYQRLLADRLDPDETLRSLAAKWTADATDDEARLRALFARVADGIRYLGLELGVHGYQPERPRLTLARGYGDCKDKAALLIALSRAVGLDAHLVLVRSRALGPVRPLPASFAIFDHAIVYFPAIDRFVDPTQDHSDPFALPPSDQGALAFVVGRDAAPRIIPSARADAAIDDLKLSATWEGRGVTTGRFTWRLSGPDATSMRKQLEAAADRREAFGHLLARRLDGITVASFTVTGLSPALDPLVMEGEAHFGRPSSRNEMTVMARPWHLVETFAPSAARRTSALLEHRSVRRVELLWEGPDLGPFESLPNVSVSGPFGSARREVELVPASGGPRPHSTLRLRLEHRQEVFEVSPTEYETFRHFLVDVDAVTGKVLAPRSRE